MAIDDPLTEYGKQQIEHLGHDWKDVHIDAIYSSTFQSAYYSALQIAKHNHDPTLEATKSPLLDDRRKGQAVINALLTGNSESAATLYMRLKPGQNGATPRDYRPPGGGGESPNAVAFRAKQGLIMLLKNYGKDLDAPPKDFLDKFVIDSPNILPEGIPHVVIVSHNIFLAELYEAMFRWNSTTVMVDGK